MDKNHVSHKTAAHSLISQMDKNHVSHKTAAHSLISQMDKNHVSHKTAAHSLIMASKLIREKRTKTLWFLYWITERTGRHLSGEMSGKIQVRKFSGS